ncbi:Ff.00g064490.m01.CDS01 [Fusarium sp. VM40]|nr:Ff.00g064490.m01.CDS01 [Fusarium sp. VM40]
MLKTGLLRSKTNTRGSRIEFIALPLRRILAGHLGVALSLEALMLLSRSSSRSQRDSPSFSNKGQYITTTSNFVGTIDAIAIKDEMNRLRDT